MKNLKMSIALTVIIAQVFWSVSGYANPSGPTVTSGSATISTSGNTETINQSTNQLITNWQSFSIAAGETTQFIQPSASSVALNRVIGTSPSDIYGALKSNGQVFLINQNGILFAPGSQVNVGGLVASTLDISDSQFLSGQYQAMNSSGQSKTVNGYYFIAPSGFGSVINQGTININAPGGYAALLGSNVENTGAIMTTAGTVALASGNEIAVNLDAAGSVSAVIVKKGLTTNSSGSVNGILNSGSLIGSKVILTAKSLKGLFTNLINNTGIIEASSTSTSGGRVVLSAQGGQVVNTGSIQAQNSIKIKTDGDIYLTGGNLLVNSFTGGNIKLDGDNIYLGGPIIADAGNVSINANGQMINVAGPNDVNIIANDLDLSAVNGIGTLWSINTNVSELTAVNSTSGKIDITNGSSLNALSVINDGGALGDNIFIKTMLGDINVGTITAAGLGNVTLKSAGNIYSDNASSMITANKVRLIADDNIGTSTNPINTNVNDITAISKVAGNIYLNQATDVTLDNINAANGLIDITADGQITADNVTTGGGADNSITLTTTFGDIDVGNIDADGGLGDVTINSAGNIYDINSSSMITANNLSLTAGINGSAVGDLLLLGTKVGTYVVNGHQVLVIDNQPGAATYNIYFRSGLFGAWQEVATNVSASDGSKTIWTDPTPALTGQFASYYVQVATAQTSNIGTSAARINTNVNNITADSQDIGNIYLNQATDVNLNNVYANNGLIDIIADGQINAYNVATGGGAANGITLTTTFGDIDVGSISAAGGLGDVTLNSAGNIYDISFSSLITANNLNLSAGVSSSPVGMQLFLGTNVNTYVLNGHQVLVIKNQPGAAQYNIYFRSGFSGPWQEVQTDLGVSDGSTTIWTDPTPALIGQFASYYVQVVAASTSNIGTSIKPLNTNVNNITADSQDVGDIHINQSSTPVTLSNVSANNGLIDVNANGQITANNVVTGGNSSGNNISLTNTNGDIYLGNISAAGGASDVTVNSAGNIYDANTPAMITANNLTLAAMKNIGSGTNRRINTSANNVVATSADFGDIYLNLNQANGVTLSDVYANNGLIDIIADGGITADYVVTAGGVSSNTISLQTSFGDIDVGHISAPGSTVTLNSAANIYDINANSMITADNFNFTSGAVVGTQAAVSPSVINGNIVLNIQNTGEGASYNVYSSTTPNGPWQLVASNVAATGGSSTQWTGPAVTSAPTGFYIVKVASATSSNVGTSTNPINTNVNTINGQANTATSGNIYLNQQAKAVTLANLNAATGSINVTAAGPMSAENVTTGGGASDSINLTTTSGNLDTGTLNAAGGLADVNLSSAASITNNSGNGSITANNFNFTSGTVVGTQAAVSPSIVSGNIVLNIQNSDGSASYNIYSSSSPTGPWQLVANVPATGGASTQWTGPAATGPSGYFIVKVGSAASSNVGTSSNPINTTVNTINGQANAATTGSIYLKQSKRVTLGNLNATTGSINVVSGGPMTAQNVTTGGDASDSINLTTNLGGIDTGTINAAGGLADVNLNSAASITNNSGNGLITANNFNFTSGNVVGTGASVIPSVSGGDIVLTIYNPIEAQTYNIYSVALGSAPVLIATIPASSGPTTQWIGPAVSSAPNAFFTVSIASAAGVGTNTNPINTNVNTINGQANALTGGIYINQAKAVTLGNLHAITGSINVTSAGEITAENLTTGSGGALDSINLNTTSGGIDVGALNAAGGLGDVSLNSAADITNNSGTGLITADNFNFTSGNVFTGPLSSGDVGTSANPINTDVNTINGQAHIIAIPGESANIYLNQLKAVNLSNLTTNDGDINVTSNGTMTVGDITAAARPGGGSITLTANSGDIDVNSIDATGDVNLNSVNGSILGIGGGTNVSSGGNTSLSTGNVIGSWNPYIPLNVNVGGNLLLSIGNSASSATGSVGILPVSGTLGGTVAGVNVFLPGTYTVSNGAFTGNPPGYIFLNKTEIWPNVPVTPTPTPTPTITSAVTNNNDALAALQVSNSIQPNQGVYYEKQRRHLIRPVEVAAPLSVAAYHATLQSNISAIDHFTVAPEAYDYIDARIHLNVRSKSDSQGQ